MSQPGSQRSLNLLCRDAALRIFPFHLPQATVEAGNRPLLQPATVAPDNAAQELQTHAARSDVGLFRVQSQPDLRKLFAQGRQLIPSPTRLVVQHAFARFHDLADQRYQFSIADRPGKQFQQDVMIHVREEANDIRFQIMCVPAEINLSPIQRAMGALAAPAGVTVVNEAAFVDWFQDLDNRVMQHSVSKWRCADLSRFGILDEKMMVSTGLVSTTDQVSLKL
jgi:hypothetical protein